MATTQLFWGGYTNPWNWVVVFFIYLLSRIPLVQKYMCMPAGMHLTTVDWNLSCDYKEGFH